MPQPLLHSVNVGRPRESVFLGRQVKSSIWKTPVDGPVDARGVNLEGDDQADREVHGGVDKAVYGYALEDLAYWEREIGRSLPPGTFGENLTTSGMDVTGAVVGERWEIGTVVLEVSQPRAPCWKLGMRMEEPEFPRRFTEVGRPGAYLRITKEGTLAAGDPIRIAHRPTHGLTVGDVFRIFTRERHRVGDLLSIPELAESWHEWARKRSAR